MYRDHTIGVVVPAYNEEGFVGEVIETMPEYVDRIYVIDDASTDDTWNEIQRHAVAENNRFQRPADESQSADSDRGGTEATYATDGAGAFDRRVVPIQHDHNRGVGGAIKTGYKHALADEVDVTAVMGGDGQMNPTQLQRLLDPIVDGEADYAKGNRLLYKEFREGMSRWRFFGNSILTVLTKIASGYWKMMDPQNGYTAISYHALDTVEIDEVYEYYGYCNDLLVKLNAKGMRIADVAMPAEYGDETSHISYPTYVRRVSLMLLRNFFWRLRVRYLVLDFHPLSLFYFFGIGTTITGTLGGIWSLIAWKRFGYPLFVRAALSLMVFLVGSLFVLFAMLFDMQVNEGKEVQIYE